MTRSDADVIVDQVDPLLEELLVEVVTGARPEPRENSRESISTALTEAAMASFSRVVAQASEVDRKLLAEALAPALAKLLAPALAQAIAPRIVAVLSHIATASGHIATASGHIATASGHIATASGHIATASEEVSQESEWGGEEKSKSSTRANGSLGKGGRK